MDFYYWYLLWKIFINLGDFMRYAQIREMDISNGIGIGIAIFLQGCHIHCKNCFNKELWDFNKGKIFTKDTLNNIIELCKNSYISRISILGGEPLSEENLNELLNTCIKIKENIPNIKIWLYTGYLYEELNEKQKEVVKNIDILVDGPYIDDKKNLNLKFKGSENQRIIDIKNTLLNKEIKLLDI